MSKKTVAELLVETLAGAGVERIYGVAGDSLNGVTDSLRKRDDIQWIAVRHEEAAAFAAGAEAHLSGRLAVCMICDSPSTSVHSNDFFEPYTSKLSRYCRAVSYKNRQMCAATSLSAILMWHDSTANLLPDFF